MGWLADRVAFLEKGHGLLNLWLCCFFCFFLLAQPKKGKLWNYWHCGGRIILPQRQNWWQVVKILPKSCDPTVWNGKMWLGKIQTTCCNILPPRQNNPAPAVWCRGWFWSLGLKLGLGMKCCNDKMQCYRNNVEIKSVSVLVREITSTR